VAARIRRATIVITNVVAVTPADMDAAPHLRLLAILATGMAWVDRPYCARRRISVVNAPSSNVDAVSEHFLALYFASRKRLVAVDRNVKTSDEWLRTTSLTKTIWPAGPPLGCKQETLAIVGYGTLGRRIEALARGVGFGEILIAERKGAREIRAGRVGFDDAMRRSTVVVLVLPREPDTVDLIGEPELRTMRQEMVLINVARGGIVNEAALAKALREGWIFGAATDVLDAEPGGPGTTPLLPREGEEDVPNLLVSSHVAWFSGQTIKNLQNLNRDGMTAFVEGRMYDPAIRGCVAVHDGEIWK
jgi:glycerate dehydrogenase